MGNIIVTGGAGFIGSCLVRALVHQTAHTVVNLDKLTYAGNLDSLASIEEHPRYRFQKLDICDRAGLRQVFEDHSPLGIFHLAAESHVDRSITEPSAFIRTNVEGTFTLLETAQAYQAKKDPEAASRFRFMHVSTDEVYGSLGPEGLFNEQTRYDPRSPYSATKAASDHLARAWHHTYGIPVVVTNCSNNYGPYQFPEKLIPLVITKALRREPIPVYGKGENIRDWLFVEDHVRALILAFEEGVPGETYNIGGRAESTNLDLVVKICALLDELAPDRPEGGFGSLITFVEDRPGHDLRYAIDTAKIERELHWHPRVTLSSGLRQTVNWYLANQDWCARVTSGKYRQERLGTLGV